MPRADDPTLRFDGRVEAYERWRPAYPPAAVETLAAACGLGGGSTVADLGSGTGIWSELLLATGCRVLAVEPNAAMRTAAERRLGEHPRFLSVAGRAEATGLPDASVDLVTAAQAGHWFEPAPARREIGRIVRPDAWLALVWNERLTAGDPFLAAYEELLHEHGTDYRRVDHRRMGEAELVPYFGPAGFTPRQFPNAQRLDLAGLRGRLLSSSYVPGEGDPRLPPMLARLEEIFAEHQREERVVLRYTTRLYYGRPASSP